MRLKRISIKTIVYILVGCLLMGYAVEGIGTRREVLHYLETRGAEDANVSFFAWCITAKWTSNGYEYYTQQDVGSINAIKEIVKDNIVIRDLHIRISNSDGNRQRPLNPEREINKLTERSRRNEKNYPLLHRKR